MAIPQPGTGKRSYPRGGPKDRPRVGRIQWTPADPAAGEDIWEDWFEVESHWREGLGRWRPKPGPKP